MSYQRLREKGPAAFADQTGRKKYWDLLRSERESFLDPVSGRARSELVEHSACAACGADSPYDCFVKEGFAYVRCSSCGTVYIDPQLTEASVMRFWAGSKAADAWADVLFHPAQREYDEKKFERALSDLAQAGVTQGSLLDFGSGVGLFLSLAARRGYSAIGVEPGRRARELASRHFGARVESSLEEVQTQPFDVITSWEVLEHTKQPLEYLRVLRQKIAPDGRLVVLVGGNAASLANRIMQSKSAAFDFARFWYFTPDSFRILLARAQWAVVSMRQMLDEIDVVDSYLSYGDPYGTPQYSEKVITADLLTALRQSALEGEMGYKFQVIARPV